MNTVALAPDNQARMIRVQLRWLTRLRWAAAGAVLLAAAVDALLLNWPNHPAWLGALGGAILADNLVFWLLLRPAEASRWPSPRITACAQVLLDLAALALLVAWTGGAFSPLLGLFVLHMVFASLLLPRPLAYAIAAAAVLLVAAALRFHDLWPRTREPAMILAGWIVAMLLTVFVANHIVGVLHRHRWRLSQRNRRVRALMQRIEQQREALIQHEKVAAMGQMAAGVAHEIANPLASMDGLLQLVERNPQRATPQNITKLREQIQRIKTTLQQLTNFAHPVDQQWQATPINELVESAVEMVRFDRRRKRIEVEHVLHARRCAVVAQPHAVQQVLVNVLLNALDALADVPSPRLRVTTSCDNGCRIEVSDNGPGIEPDVMTRLFEPFFTTKPVGKGTGLGLAISQTLIDRQGGAMHIESTPGQGTTVVITLRCERQRLLEPAEASA